MFAFTLKALHFTRARNWVKKAHEFSNDDPVTSFICAWISFNHYYSTFAAENMKQFHNWSQKNLNGAQGDKAQWLFLLNSKEFSNFFADYRAKHTKCFELSVTLPIISMLNHNPVPGNIVGDTKLKDLTDVQIFESIYQIRNNLFHGSKDPETDKRDRDLCFSSGKFLIPLLAGLLANTQGEVINAYDEEAQALREYIHKM